MVVLINLLIAMLSDTYQRIQARSDLEWKYGRAKLIMNMDKSAVSPPPVNVVTVLGTYAYQGTKVCIAKIKHRDGTESIEELTPKDKSSLGGSGLMQWRKSFQSSPEGGVAQNFRKIPLKKLIDVIDWDSIVSAYRGGSVTDYEPESNGVILGLEHEN